MSDLTGYEEAKETDQYLLPSKWEKYNHGSWRMDVEVDIAMDSRRDGVNNAEINDVESESESEIDDESETEQETSDSDDDE